MYIILTTIILCVKPKFKKILGYICVTINKTTCAKRKNHDKEDNDNTFDGNTFFRRYSYGK